jgi:hypothetical protein
LAGLWIWLASRVGLAAITLVAWIGDERRHLGIRTVAAKWAFQWDSVWFLNIAHRGYLRTPDEADAAFFPVYPMLIRALTPIFVRDWIAALVVANIALLALLVLLYRLAEQEFGADPANRTIFYLVAFPTGFFLTAAYNQSLFLALMVGSFYCMRRGKWWVAGLLGAVACATRSAGLLLILPFCYEYLRQRGRRIRLDALAAALIPLGLVAVMAVDKVAMGDPMAFSHAQSRHWGRHFDWPWVPIGNAFKAVFVHARSATSEHWSHNLLELGAVLLVLVMIGLAVVGPWRMRRDQLVFPLFALASLVFTISFPTSSPGIPYPLYSASRLVLEVFPAFMMLGRIGRHPLVDRALLAGFLGVQGLLVAHFLHGGWVA